MSIVSISSAQISELDQDAYCRPIRPLKHTVSTRWHMVFMAILFIIQFALSMSISYLLWQNKYHHEFWISMVFVLIFYFIGFCLGFMALTSQSHDSFLLCILLLLCGIIIIPILLPIIICIFCIKEALQNYSKMQLMVNIIPLFMYITIEFIFGLSLLSNHSITLNYTFDDAQWEDGKTYDLSWFITLSVFVCILYYIDVFILILFHGQHNVTIYFKSALFMATTICLELLLITICIIIHFYVDNWNDVDSSHQHLVTFGLINYVTISIPFSAIFCVWKWIKHTEHHSYINDLVSYDLSIKMEELYDRFYSYIHLLSHTALPRKRIKTYNNAASSNYYEINRDINLDDLSTSLLSGNEEKHIVTHCNADNTCFRYQYEYFKFNLKQKKKYISVINEVGKLPYLSIYTRFKLYTSNKCHGSSLVKFIYFCSRIYSYLFALYWFIYIYIDTESKHNVDNDTGFDEWIINDHNKYEHIFVVAVILLYLIFLIIFITMIYIFARIEYYYGYIMGMKIDWKAINHFSRCLKRNKIIMQQTNNYKIACIIISYLKNNHSSYNWIFSPSLPHV